MSTQRSILSFVKSKSTVGIPSNQSKETLSQAETLNSEDQQRATDTSTSRLRGLLYVRGTSSTNSEFSEQGVDLITTGNQSSSVELEVLESANEQDIDW